MPLAKFSNHFSSKEAIDLLVSTIQAREVGFDQLIIDVGLFVNDSLEDIKNTSMLMVDAGVVSFAEGKSSLYYSGVDQNYFQAIRNYLLDCLISEGLVKSIKHHPEFSLCIDSFLLPQSYVTYPHIAYSAGLLDLPIYARYWPFMETFKDSVLTGIREQISSPVHNNFSSLDLENKLKAQSEAGMRAELWYLNKEKERLANHLLVDCIKHVSIENVAAGFDIASFKNLESLSLDKHIEVKSYVDTPSFYISENELLVAKELKDNYFLVLIDRSKMNSPDYSPFEFSDPYSLLMTADRPDWIDIKPSNLFVTLKF